MGAIFRNFCIGTVACGLLATAPASAQQAQPPSQNATINLIRLLVKQGVISQKNADALVKEAEQEAEQAKAQQTAQAAAPVVAAPGAPPVPPPPAPGVLRVPYVPEIVKNQIRDEVKKEVVQQARDENWAQPETIPEWTKRIKLSGDFRFRDEYDLYSSTNDDTIIDYASFNANGPTDVNPITNNGGIPVLNTTQDRINRLSIRARLGVDAVISDGVLFGLRLASGGDNGPVSTTQLLGGGFGKKDIWLDQAYLTLEHSHWLAGTFGRMPDPFFHSDLVFDPDLNFDGVTAAFDSKRPDAKGVSFFATEGFFPLGYIGNNFPDHALGQIDANGNPIIDKAKDHQSWLWGSQVGMKWLGDSFDWRFAGSYYDFDGIQGQLSSPCTLYLGGKECSTDYTRPAFMQKGNTLFLLRQIVVNPDNQTGTAQPEFVGLAYKYQLVDATTEFSLKLSDAYRFVFDLDYVHNLAFDANDACRNAPFGLPLNNIVAGKGGNLDPCDAPLVSGQSKARIRSGPDGFYVSTTFGDPKPRKAWAWNVSVGYKYLEPDAVPDGFTDSDFHLGGTNARGFIVSGSLGLFNNTWVTARWLSASEIYGPPLAIDVMQLDLNTGF